MSKVSETVLDEEILLFPLTARTDNAPKVRFSATLGQEPEIELSLARYASRLVWDVSAKCSPVRDGVSKRRASSANSESEAVKGKGLHAVPASLRSTTRLITP